MDDAVPRSILLIILILAGGFFSGAETALSFCNRIRMQVMADDGDRRAERVVGIVEQFDRTVVTLPAHLSLRCRRSSGWATAVPSWQRLS